MSVINKGSDLVHDGVVNHIVPLSTLSFLNSNVMNEFISVVSTNKLLAKTGCGGSGVGDMGTMERKTRVVGMMG